MGRHECLRIPSDPSHSDSTEQVNDVWSYLVGPAKHGSQHVDRPPQEAPRVGSPPLAPFRDSLPQLPFFLQASHLETIRCLLRAKQFSEDAASPLLRGGEPLTPISQSGLSTKLGVGKKGFIQSFPLFPS
jgi:hypothetical protein